MGPPPCSNCGSLDVKKLEMPGDVLAVNVFQCEPCGHVWTADIKTNEVVTHVTRPTQASKASV